MRPRWTGRWRRPSRSSRVMPPPTKSHLPSIEHASGTHARAPRWPAGRPAAAPSDMPSSSHSSWRRVPDRPGLAPVRDAVEERLAVALGEHLGVAHLVHPPVLRQHHGTDRERSRPRPSADLVDADHRSRGPRPTTPARRPARGPWPSAPCAAAARSVHSSGPTLPPRSEAPAAASPTYGEPMAIEHRYRSELRWAGSTGGGCARPTSGPTSSPRHQRWTRCA